MSGFAGRYPSKHQRQEKNTLHVYAHNSRKESVDRAAGLVVFTEQIKQSVPRCSGHSVNNLNINEASTRYAQLLDLELLFLD